MYKFMLRSILMLLLPIAMISGIRAQDNGTAIDAFSQRSMQVGDSDWSDEQLATETGSMGDVPVDGGLSLLLAAGVALGGRRLAVKWRKQRD